MCIFKTIYLTIISLIVLVVLLTFMPTNYTKQCVIKLKDIKLNEQNKITIYENGAIIKGNKLYIISDVLDETKIDYKIEENPNYIYIKTFS